MYSVILLSSSLLYGFTVHIQKQKSRISSSQSRFLYCALLLQPNSHILIRMLVRLLFAVTSYCQFFTRASKIISLNLTTKSRIKKSRSDVQILFRQMLLYDTEYMIPALLRNEESSTVFILK